MKTFPLSTTNLTVPSIVAGMMRIAKLDDQAIRALIGAALDAGINFFDHADIYGGSMHRCETRFAEALNWSAAEREAVILQTKCGICPNDDVTYFDFSREHILRQVEGSLRALRTDYIDILLLHRPDAWVEPDEVAAAFDELQAAGKVRHFGVSNHTPYQIDFLKKSVNQPLVANQLQLSITHAPFVAQGIAMNMLGEDQAISRDLGIIDYCRLHEITIQAWSPFQAGFFTGTFVDNPQYEALNAVLTRLAEKYGVTPTGIASAWITSHPARMQVVYGTRTPARVAEIAAGAEVQLTKPEWYELFQAAGHIVP
ncbi:MAG: aldo/keto reductase [Propionibacteriaceae bacterium]|jgi:predicted oxidoreductase|nr:aldo/keto reductase [Propionibacteriaceae bacterium]